MVDLGRASHAIPTHPTANGVGLWAILAFTLLSGPVHAQWLPGGRGVSTGSSVSDGAGNLISRGNTKVDTTGAIVWSSSLSGTASAPDGAGGAMITYSQSGIRAARVSTGGAVLWSGVVLTASSSTAYHVIATDAAGNAFAGWKIQFPQTDNRLFVAKVSSSGVLQWPAGGVLVCDAIANNIGTTNLTIVPDESGGCYLVWEDFRAGTGAGPTDVYGQHVTSAGTVAWAANGMAIASGPEWQRPGSACSDGSGGVIVAWHDGRNGDYDIYAQRLDASGASLWPAGGLRVYTDADGNAQDQTWPSIVADGLGGVFLAWSDDRNAGLNNGSDIFAQRIDSFGLVQWGADGVAVAASTNSETSAKIVLDGTGGAFVGWQADPPAGLVQHLNGAGGAQWMANGVRPLTSSPVNTPDIVPDGVGGCYFGQQGLLARVLPTGKPAWGRDYQAILSVGDAPGDEGGWVHTTFNRPAPDGWIYSPQVSGYSVWRRRAGSAPSAAPARLEDPRGILAGMASVPSVGSYLTGYTEFPPGTWDVAAYTPAFVLPSYSMLVPTHTDSTSAGPGNDDIVVMSHTSTPTVFVVSPGATGHSVDNLAPGAPQNVAGGQSGPTNVLIQWSPRPESDLLLYAVYKGASPSFVPSPSNRIGQPTEASFEDGTFEPGVSHYKVSAIDRHENESSHALLTPAQIVSVPPGTTPTRTYFAPAVPNPYRDVTALEYGIAHRSHVSIEVYDSGGRRVIGLVGEVRDPGVYRAVWDGADERRHPVPAGLYLVRMLADHLRQNLKIVRLE